MAEIDCAQYDSDAGADLANFYAQANPDTILTLLAERDALIARAEAAESEQHRLHGCLRLANSNAEHFEREWYLCRDALEAAERDAERLDFVLSQQAIMFTTSTDASGVAYQLMIQNEDEEFVSISGEGRFFAVKCDAVDAAMQQEAGE